MVPPKGHKARKPLLFLVTVHRNRITIWILPNIHIFRLRLNNIPSIAFLSQSIPICFGVIETEPCKCPQARVTDTCQGTTDTVGKREPPTLVTYVTSVTSLGSVNSTHVRFS